MSEKPGFHWGDWLVFAGTLVVSLGIGVFFALSGGRQKTTGEYLTGNRDLNVIAVAASMFMSYISAILVLGNTAEMYTRGTMFWLGGVGSSIAFIVAAALFVPLFYPMNLTSSFEYLEKRFQSKAVKLLGSCFLVIYQLIYMGIAMYSPATALAAVVDFPVWGSIVSIGVVGTIYTTIGGMKAVVWTDVFQGVVLFSGVIAVLIIGSVNVGGIAEVWRISYEGGRINFDDFNPDPTVRLTFWSIIIGRFFISLNTVGTGQTSVQRYVSLPSLAKARLSVLINIPAILLVYTLTCLCGLTVYAYYEKKGCGPLENGDISNSNQLLPYFIMETMNYPGLPGLFLAVLFSGALSSISSSLNSLAAVTWKDFLEWKFHDLSEFNKAIVTKGLSGFYGAIAIGMAFLAEILGGHVLQASQSFVGGVGGPTLGMFMLGGFFPCANWVGAFSGGLAGLWMAGWISVGAYVYKPHPVVLKTSILNCTRPGLNLTTMAATMTTDMMTTTPKPPIFPYYTISYMYYAAIGCLTTVLFGLVVSLISGGNDTSKQDPRYIIPVFDWLCCCLPSSWRRPCWCGVDREKTPEDESKDGYDQKAALNQAFVDSEQMEVKVSGGPIGGYTPYNDQDIIKRTPPLVEDDKLTTVL